MIVEVQNNLSETRPKKYRLPNEIYTFLFFIFAFLMHACHVGILILDGTCAPLMLVGYSFR